MRNVRSFVAILVAILCLSLGATSAFAEVPRTNMSLSAMKLNLTDEATPPKIKQIRFFGEAGTSTEWSLSGIYLFKSKEFVPVTLAPPVLQVDDLLTVSFLDIDVRPLVGVADGLGGVGGVLCHRTGVAFAKGARANGGLYGWIQQGRPVAGGIWVGLQFDLPN